MKNERAFRYRLNGGRWEDVVGYDLDSVCRDLAQWFPVEYGDIEIESYTRPDERTVIQRGPQTRKTS